MGVNAVTAAGDWLALVGVDQVRPPSADLVSAMSLWTPPLNRLSSNTAYSVPFRGSTAMSGRPPPTSEPERCGVPLSGSRTGVTVLSVITTGLDQVAPPSVERIAPSSEAFGVPKPFQNRKTSTSEPSGSTAIWLPIVARFLFCARMSRGVDQVAPPSVVIEK